MASPSVIIPWNANKCFLLAFHGLNSQRKETEIEKIESNILYWLKERGEVTRRELFRLLQRQYPRLKETSFDWILYKLVGKSMIARTGRGCYGMQGKVVYRPSVSPRLRNIFVKVKKRYNPEDLLVWETIWLNDFMIHQPFHSMIVLETEPDLMKTVFDLLKDTVSNQVFLRRGFAAQSTNLGALIDDYILEAKQPIIVQKSISRSPWAEVRKVTIPTLEKILVDLFCDPILFTTYQGSELETIYLTAFKRYAIDSKKLLSYANRRGKKEPLAAFLSALQLWDVS